MSLYVVSVRPALSDMVKAALKIGEVPTFSTPASLLKHLLERSRSKWELILLNLEHASDARHFIDFVKSSAPLAGVQIVAIGTEEQILALGASTLAMLDSMLIAPCTAIEIAVIVAQLQERREARLNDPPA
jgi:hypothetical protein